MYFEVMMLLILLLYRIEEVAVLSRYYNDNEVYRRGLQFHAEKMHPPVSISSHNEIDTILPPADVSDATVGTAFNAPHLMEG